MNHKRWVITFFIDFGDPWLVWKLKSLCRSTLGEVKSIFLIIEWSIYNNDSIIETCSWIHGLLDLTVDWNDMSVRRNLTCCANILTSTSNFWWNMFIIICEMTENFLGLWTGLRGTSTSLPSWISKNLISVLRTLLLKKFTNHKGPGITKGLDDNEDIHDFLKDGDRGFKDPVRTLTSWGALFVNWTPYTKGYRVS